MDISIMISTVTSIFATSVGIFGIYYGWKQSEKQLQAQRELQQKEFEKRDETDRREFLINFIKDPELAKAARIEAALEYLKRGYNGVTKQYILANRLVDERIIEIFRTDDKKT